MTQLEEIEAARLQSRERLRLKVREELRAALVEMLPARELFVFGSLVKPGRFTEHSDVDLALESEPPGMTIYQMTSLLAERLGRSVDIVLLPRCRFRDK